MSGYILRIRKNEELDNINLENQAVLLSNPYRYNSVFNYENQNLALCSINNQSNTCLLENKNWLLFIYGIFYPKNSTPITCENLINTLSLENLEKNFSKLSGSFSLFLWDKRNNNFFVVSDRIGSIPVYITNLQNDILISTEWKTFVGFKSFAPELNRHSVLNSLLFGRVKFTNQPFCRQVISSNPGSIMKIAKNYDIEEKLYYQYRDKSPSSVDNLDDLMNSSTTKFSKMVNDHIDCYEKPALFLSGGIDSRLLAASLSKENRNKILAVSFGMPGNNESFIANEVATALNLQYVNFDLCPNHFIDYANMGVNITEGQDLFAQGYLSYVCDQLRLGWDVDGILDGMEIGVSLGGDFLRESFKHIKLENFAQNLFEKFYIHNYSLSEVFIDDVRPTIEDLFGETLNKISDLKNPFEMFDHIYIENYTREVMRLRHRIIRRSTFDIMLISDERYLELVSSTPPELKLDIKCENSILDRLNQDLLNIRYHNSLLPLNVPHELWGKSRKLLTDYERLTQEIWSNYKINVPYNHYFTNFSEWFRSNKSMKNFLYDNLLSANCRVSEKFVKKEWVQKILHEHFQGTSDNRTSISYLLSIELFMKQFGL